MRKREKQCVRESERERRRDFPTCERERSRKKEKE